MPSLTLYKLVSCNALKINYIRACSVRSMKQGKLKMVKQETERVNIDILGINELKCTGMGEFNTDDHYVYNSGKNSLEEME